MMQVKVHLKGKVRPIFRPREMVRVFDPRDAAALQAQIDSVQPGSRRFLLDPDSAESIEVADNFSGPTGSDGPSD